MQYDTYIFDLDGTLLNTLSDLKNAVNYALRTLSCPLRSEGEVKSFIGNGIKKLVERALPDGKKELKDEALALFKEYYIAHIDVCTKPYDGVKELLARLKKAGKVVAVATNKADFAAKSLCEKLLPNLIDCIVGEDENNGVKRKPAPDTVEIILEKFGKNAVYIGDTEVDMETAKNAKLPCVCVSWGYRSRDELALLGATVIADTPEDIF